MPSSVKNKLVSKMNIDQLDDVDSMIDDFLVDDNDYNDDDEYFTAVSNETHISYSSYSSCSSVTASEYTQLTSTTYNIEYYDKSVFEDISNKNNENTTNNIYSSIFFYLSFFDFTKYFN
jgi:hypothetical protein